MDKTRRTRLNAYFVTTLERIVKALGMSLSDLFTFIEELKEINSIEKSIMKKVA